MPVPPVQTSAIYSSIAPSASYLSCICSMYAVCVLRLFSATALASKLKPAVEAAYEKAALRDIPIRRLAICFGDVCDEGCEGYDLFTDWNSIEKEKSRDKAVLEITQKYGKNAVLRGVNFYEGATQRERNEMIGGHRAGYDDPRAKS